jgi:sugar lactone lactonase YvrE
MVAFETSWPRALASIEVIPEKDLLAPSPLWVDDDPLWVQVGANTFWHYPAHIAKIEAWLEQAKSRGE